MTQVIGVCFKWTISPSIWDRYSAISQPSLSANVSAAKVERTTLLTLLEFYISGQNLLWKSVRKIIWPPWLPPSGRLLKLAPVYKFNCVWIKAWEEDLVLPFFTRFPTLYSSITSWSFMLLTLCFHVVECYKYLNWCQILRYQITS